MTNNWPTHTHKQNVLLKTTAILTKVLFVVIPLKQHTFTKNRINQYKPSGQIRLNSNYELSARDHTISREDSIKDRQDRHWTAYRCKECY